MIDNPVLMAILIAGLIIAFIWMVRNYTPKKVILQKASEVRPHKDRCPLGKYLEGLNGEAIIVVDFNYGGIPIVQRVSDHKREKFGEQPCFALWRAEEFKLIQGATYEFFKNSEGKTSLACIGLSDESVSV